MSNEGQLPRVKLLLRPGLETCKKQAVETNRFRDEAFKAANVRLVWAKSPGCIAWPALASPSAGGRYECRFFAHRGGSVFLPAEVCQPFVEHLERCTYKPEKMRKSYAKAVSEACTWMEEHCVRRSARRPVARDLVAEAAAILPDFKTTSCRTTSGKRSPKRGEHSHSKARHKRERATSPAELLPLRNTSPAEIVCHGFVECHGAALI